MLDRRKTQPDSQSEKSQDETEKRHQHNFLDRATPSTSSEKSHDGISPLLREEISEKGLVEINKYQEKKERLERAEEALLEAKGKINCETVEKCKLLIQQFGENKNEITKIDAEIDGLYAQEKKITEKNEHSRKNLEENEKEYKDKQAALEAKQERLKVIKSKLSEIDAEIAKQKKNHQELKSYQETVLSLNNSSPTDDMVSQDVKRSLDAVFNSPLFRLGTDQKSFQKLKKTYKEKCHLSKQVFEYVHQKQEKTTKRNKNEKEADHSKSGVTSNQEFQKVRNDVKERLYSELGISEIPSNIQFNDDLRKTINEIANSKFDKTLNEKTKEITEIIANIESNSDNNTNELIKYRLEVELFKRYFDLLTHCKRKVEGNLFKAMNLESEIASHKTTIDNYNELESLYNEECDLAKNSIQAGSSTASPQNDEQILKLREKIEIHKNQVIKFINNVNVPEELRMRTQSIQKRHLTVDPLPIDIVPVTADQKLISDHLETVRGELKKIQKERGELSSKFLKDKPQVLYYYYLDKALHGYETSLERIMEYDHEVLRKIKVELKRQIETGNFYSQIEKEIQSSDDKLANLEKEYSSHEKINNDLQLKISQIEEDMPKQKESIIKQRGIIKIREKELYKAKGALQEEISKKKKKLVQTKKEGNDIRKELNKLEPEVMPALRAVDAAQRQVDQAQMEVNHILDIIGQPFGNDHELVWKHIEACKNLLETEKMELVKQMEKLIQDLVGKRPIPYFRPTLEGVTKYINNWEKLELFTDPETKAVFDPRNVKEVNASRTLLERLKEKLTNAEAPRDPDQRFFWMRYASVMNLTLRAYQAVRQSLDAPKLEEVTTDTGTNPSDDRYKKTKGELMNIPDKLNQANTLANEFLDLMYGKQQEAS